ncbi:DUF547 domain-containing protein [bacterium]|nr:DUF547 domain-containing protein [bacterium]
MQASFPTANPLSKALFRRLGLFFGLLALLSASRALAFDHGFGTYQAVLSRFAQGGRVDYAGLAADQAGLDGFLAECAEVSFEQYRAFTKQQQMAFMVNLYNAALLKLVVSHWPIESVNLIGGLFSSAWNEKFVRLFEHTVALGHLEHDILRVEFKEPRLHFVMARGSVGGPLLSDSAYVSDLFLKRLSEAEREFLTTRPDENRFQNDTLYVSPLFRWYREDFGSEDGMRQLFRTYYPDVKPETPVVFTDWDWTLNKR